MKLHNILFGALLLVPVSASAGEWDFDYSLELNGLYGYSETSPRYQDLYKHNQDYFNGELGLSAAYEFDDSYRLSLHLDLMGAVDKELKDYNQGNWGEEAYAIADSPFGRVMLGQTTNVDAQFHTGAPTAGALQNNSDVVNFLTNPNWIRNGKTTKFATLNTTYINTDGVAPKVSYISPVFYDTYLGFSYIPDAYNRAGLISKEASYKHDDGMVASLFTSQDLDWVTVSGSAGFARFHDNDNEFAFSLSLQKGNWTLGGGYRKTYIDGEDKQQNRAYNAAMPEYFDAYREGDAYNIGIGYQIGPVQTALGYFESRAAHSDNRNKIITFSNQYQVDKNIKVYLAASHLNADGASHDNTDNNRGYALVAGLGLNF